eukprot:gene2351-2899_t
MGKGGQGVSGIRTPNRSFPPVVYNNIKPIRKTPKVLPENINLQQIIDALPQEVFEKSGFKSLSSLLLTLVFIALSVVFINQVPEWSYYLYPIGWMLLGASVTGLLVIGNDCIHRSFSTSPLVNSIVGTIVMLPLLYPFQSCKINQRETKNTLKIRDWATGKLFWVLSIINWAESYFSVKKFDDKKDKIKASVSIALVYIFAAIFFPLMLKFVGISGLLNYWFAPWLIFHFLVSTVTFLPRIPFLEEEMVKQKYLVHITYPKWIEFIVKDINLKLPRQIALNIPHYNLRKAYESFSKNFGEYIYECAFEVELLKELVNRSQYFSNEIFAPFDSTPIAKSFPISVPTEERKSRSIGQFLANLNWLHVGILVGSPILAISCVLFFNVSLTKATFIWTFIYYHCTGFGITMGYHRLWSHKSYSATLPVRIALLLFGAGAVEGSVRWWCRDHRAHHRYTDTDKDPYSAHYGFFWAHMGWMLVKQDPKKIGRANIDDLNADPWIRWQHRYYIPIAVFMGVIFPTFVAGIFWGDWIGGYFYSGLIRLIAVHHSTFMVNSLAHFLGDSTYDDKHSPRDSFITALLTFGEGYHNFHHEFPSDYRNAYKMFQFDSTKWVINILYYCGLVYDLKTFPQNEIDKSIIQMKQKSIDHLSTRIYWGADKNNLPLLTLLEFDKLVKEGRKLIIIRDMVYDVEKFINDHPGGKAYIEMGIGKDATKMFTGEVYDHSNAANNLLCQFLIATIKKEKDE